MRHNYNLDRLQYPAFLTFTRTRYLHCFDRAQSTINAFLSGFPFHFNIRLYLFDRNAIN